jgi:hypothetical protein
VPTVTLGNESVLESYKPDQGTNATKLKARTDLGQQVTTMQLNEVDGDDRPSRSMNLTLVLRFWAEHSDKPPAWVDGDDDLLNALVADELGCKIGRPKSWKVG